MIDTDWRFEVERDGEVLVYPVIEGTDGHAEMVAWIDAQGVDHREVPVPSRATIRDGMLTVELYALNEDGQRYVDETGENAARTSKTVPLVSDPPDCWWSKEPA